ncbi:MAG: S8 family serine peptidase [Pleurocapsa sp. MO_192.B19]|nr:S8 family serine peptidase [Pleurocapsa sp. MO_192.B19]
MSDELTAAQYALNQTLPEVREILSSFISDSSFNNQVSLAFSLSLAKDSNYAQEILSQWLAGEAILPKIEIISSSSINDALGAYAAETNTIYLSQEFLIQSQDNPDAVRNVLLEELGHAFSHQLNPEDTPGDKGAIFSLLVQDRAIAPEILAKLQTEDDIVTVTLNNQDLQIEQAEAGINPAFDLIGLTDLRNDPNFADIDGTGFDVVIIDSGLDRTHPLLDDNYRFGIDYIDGDNNPNDLVNHGTHVSGIIGAEDENIGVAPDVGLIGLKVGDSRQLNGSVINEALQQVLDEVTNPDSESNIVAVNLSFGNGFYTLPDQPNSLIENERRRIIRDLEAAGVVVVAAAGNNYRGKPNSEGNILDSTGNLLDPNQEPNLNTPAIYSTIAVGAVWQNNLDVFGDYSNLQIPGEDRIAVFSQRLNTDNFIFAPGVQINSTNPTNFGGNTISQNGTSQASPHVAGAVALLQEIAARYGVRLRPEQVRDYLINNADTIVDGDDEEDIVNNTGFSYPRINIHQSAIALRDDLENNSLPPDPTPGDINNAPNDIIDGAIDVTLGSDREPLIFPGILGQDRGEIVTLADVDLYRLTTPDNGILQIDIDTPYQTDFPDSYLRLFDENGEELFFTDTEQLVASDDDLAPGEVEGTLESTGEIVILNDGDTTNIVDGITDEDGNYQPGNYGHSTDSYLSFRAERGVTYYIGVSDFSNQAYDPTILNNLSASDEGGQYELIATFINDDADGSITQVTANTALPTTGLRASIGNDGESEIGDKDVDFYRLNSPTAGILEIDIDSESEASIIDSVDSVVVLFDANGNQIGLNDDTDTIDSRLRFQIEANTDYYAAVTGFGNQDFAPFALGSGSGGDTGEYIFNSRLLSLNAVTNISNNTINSDLVRDIVIGDTISGRIGEDGGYIIGATDVDIYRFVAANDDTINIRVGANQEFSADTVLRLFDANGNEIAFNDDENSLTRSSFLEVEVQAGTEYYIGINGFSQEAGNYDPLTGLGTSPGSQGDYTLSIGNIEQFNQEPIELPDQTNSNSNSSLAVYRFFRPDIGVHFYTASPTERDAVLDLANFNFEGASYQSVDPLTGSPVATPVYRFLNQDTGVHLYTASEIERDGVSELSNYTFEGEAFYAYAEAVEGSIPIHRFYNPIIDAHFYTPSETEREAVETGLPNYEYESVAYYAVPSE